MFIVKTPSIATRLLLRRWSSQWIEDLKIGTSRKLIYYAVWRRPVLQERHKESEAPLGEDVIRIVVLDMSNQRDEDAIFGSIDDLK